MKGKGKKEKESADGDDNGCPLQFLDFKPIDHMRQCPRFTAIVQRTEDESIGSEDLDVLQLELETLLVSVAKRQRLLETEMEALVNWHDSKNRDKRSPNKPVLSAEVIGKRSKQSDDKPTKKFKDNQSSSSSSGGKLQTTNRPQKAKPTKFVEADYSDAQQKAVSKKAVVKNDIPNQFWNFIEPFCCELTGDHIKLLSEQIKNYENDTEFYKIPNLGKHYSLKWDDHEIVEPKNKKKGLSPSNCSSGSSLTHNNKSKKGSKNCNSEGDKTSFGALTQRLVSCLIEENLLNGGSLDSKSMSNDLIESKGTNGSPNHKVFKSLNLGNTAQLERRIRKELEEHGIISLDDILNGSDNRGGDDDEILEEIKRCQTELKALTAKNQSQMKRLLSAAKKEMSRQDIKRKLEAADNEVIEAYRRISSAKQKKRSPTKKEKDSAKRALKEREQIVKQLENVS